MLKIDLHIHSIQSGHAYGTIYEIAAEARRKEMAMIAITDHGPAMAGAGSAIHFGMGFRAPEEIDGVRILWGCEANVINDKGELDLPERLQERMDVLLVNLHAGCGYEDCGAEQNTEVMLRALSNPRVHVLSHPGFPQYEYDRQRVYQAACDRGVLLEINLSYLRRAAEGVRRHRELVEFAKRRGVQLLVNSDAHFLHEIGDDEVLRANWDALGLSAEMIINNYPDRLRLRRV